MRALQAIGMILFLTAVGLFLFNMMYEWAAHDRLAFLSIEQLWTKIDKGSYSTTRSMASAYVPMEEWNVAARLPAPVLFVAIAGVLYLPGGIAMLFRRKQRPQ